MAQERGHILVVDDDEAIRLQLGWQLEADGYSVSLADSGTAALELLREQLPSLLVLDLTMPGIPGLDVLRTVRAAASTHRLPVIILSGRSSEADRVAGLDAGADDYLVKPFSPSELAARVRSLLRRTSPPQAPVVGDVVVDVRSREVFVRGNPIDLTAKEFDLLAFLTANPRQVFTRTQLLHQVWDNSGWQSEATVTEHVHRLRAKLDGAGCPDGITTVRGVGYRWDG
jgi:two-component system phosphate regulon response regulator PhoB